MTRWRSEVRFLVRPRMNRTTRSSVPRSFRLRHPSRSPAPSRRAMAETYGLERERSTRLSGSSGRWNAVLASTHPLAMRWLAVRGRAVGTSVGTPPNAGVGRCRAGNLGSGCRGRSTVETAARRCAPLRDGNLQSVHRRGPSCTWVERRNVSAIRRYTEQRATASPVSGSAPAGACPSRIRSA